VLFVGHLSQRKGIGYLLEAFRSLKLPNAELVLMGGLAGGGQGLAKYRDSFRHVAPVPHAELPEYYQQADIFVLPSLYEGSALVIYEALASGLPVITTPNSGSVVRDGMEGFVVPIRDARAVAEKIARLYEDRALCQATGAQARRRAEEFPWSAYRRRLAEFIRPLVAGAR
jgi:starch synthase